MGVAWERHAMCESAFISEADVTFFNPSNALTLARAVNELDSW
jgi:hypothetical protein